VKIIVKMACWKCTTSEITKSFHSSTAVISVVIKMKIYEEVVVEQIAAKHQKTSEDQETDKDDATEREGVGVEILVAIC
jgi:hypothetical protein